MLDIEEIYKEYFNVVYKYLYGLSHNKYVAEELAQETFCRAIKTINHFRGKSKVSVWLCQIAKYIWYEELKKKSICIPIDDNLEKFEFNDNIEDKLIEDENKEQIYKSIENLDENTKRVMLYRISTNMSFREIGLILGKSENWSRVTFYRGKKLLKGGNL